MVPYTFILLSPRFRLTLTGLAVHAREEYRAMAETTLSLHVDRSSIEWHGSHQWAMAFSQHFALSATHVEVKMFTASPPPFILDLGASLSEYGMMNAVIFLSPSADQIICSISLSPSNEETLEMAEKIIKPPATERQKIKEYKIAWMTWNGWENHQTTSYRATEDKGVQNRLDDRFSLAQAWRWYRCLVSQNDLSFADHVVPRWRLACT